KEDHAAQAEFARERSQFDRNLVAVEAGDEQLSNPASERGRRHGGPNYNRPVTRRVTASAPTRIDLAGGTIDIWPLYLFHDGASTLNAAISLRAHVRLEARTDGRVELRSIDTDRVVSADRWTDLDGSGDLSLLALLARYYTLENATLTTRGESPAG